MIGNLEILLVWGISITWLILATGLLIKAWRAKERLKRHSEALRSSYLGETTPITTPLEYLQVQGMRKLNEPQIAELSAGLRASAKIDRQLISSCTEMMPQLGLLGTVFSIFFSAFFAKFSLKMLGLALITTIIGLIGALLCRWFIELPSDTYYHNLTEFLSGEETLTALLHRLQSPPTPETQLSKPPTD